MTKAPAISSPEMTELRQPAASAKSTSIGGDCWPLSEYAHVDKGDLDRFSEYAAAWKSQCITPMQYLLNIMSMTPKKTNGEFRMFASVASGWRVDAKLDKPGERACNTEVADETT